MSKKRSILQKALGVSVSMIISKSVGFFRQILLIRFLGVGFISDAYNAAFMLPDTIRRIMGEGALNAALSPTLIYVRRKDGKLKFDELVTLTFLVGQGFLFVLCLLANIFAKQIIFFSAPGFSLEKQICAIGLSKILVFFVFFVTGASILGSALISRSRFFVPANSQTIINLLLVFELLFCIRFNLSVFIFAYFFVFNGLVLILIHLWGYLLADGAFACPTEKSRQWFWSVLKKFLPSLLVAGSTEISFIIDRIMASYLPTGSISLISWSATIFRIPLGIFVFAFTVVLLPKMSKVALYAPKRLWFYLHEALKLFLWVIIPVSILMVGYSHKIFLTIFLSDKFPLNLVMKASELLMIFSSVLIFFSINRILVNIFYAYQDTFKPAILALFCACLNTGLNFFLMKKIGVFGIALSTGIAAAVQVFLLFFVLYRSYGLVVYFRSFGIFLVKMAKQLILLGSVFCGLYFLILKLIEYLPEKFALFFSCDIGFWFWVLPLWSMFFILMYLSRGYFGLRFYFLNWDR